MALKSKLITVTSTMKTKPWIECCPKPLLKIQRIKVSDLNWCNRYHWVSRKIQNRQFQIVTGSNRRKSQVSLIMNRSINNLRERNQKLVYQIHPTWAKTWRPICIKVIKEERNPWSVKIAGGIWRRQLKFHLTKRLHKRQISILMSGINHQVRNHKDPKAQNLEGSQAPALILS